MKLFSFVFFIGLFFINSLVIAETATRPINITVAKPTVTQAATQAIQIPSLPLEAVDYVDVTKYLGRWYQIARNPLPFEPSDCVCAQQTLSLSPAGDVDVYNSCNVGNPSGPRQEIRGKAYSQDPIKNSTFTVDFNLPVLGQYWIIALAQNYAWAVVSDPSRRSLYILSKTPNLDVQTYAKALSDASLQISLDKLKFTDQNNCVYP